MVACPLPFLQVGITPRRFTPSNHLLAVIMAQSTDNLDTRTKRILRRAQRLDDMQQAALLEEIEGTLALMERARTYAQHMGEEAMEVWRNLKRA